MNHNPATQATPATVSELDELEHAVYASVDVDYAAFAGDVSGRVVGVTDETFRGLIATARAYHALRELAGELVSAAERVRNYGETLSYECFECGGEHEYWGIDIGDSHSLGWAEQQLAAFLKHPACDPTDAGSGDVAGEGQSE